MGAYQPQGSEKVTNVIIVWYSKALGEPLKLILNVDDDKVIELVPDRKRLGRMQENSSERVGAVLLGGMLGNPNYKL